MTSSWSRQSSSSRPIWWPSMEGVASSWGRWAVSKAGPSFSGSLPLSLPPVRLAVHPRAGCRVGEARARHLRWGIVPALGQHVTALTPVSSSAKGHHTGPGAKWVVVSPLPRTHAACRAFISSGCSKVGIFFHLSLSFSSFGCDMLWCGFLGPSARGVWMFLEQWVSVFHHV